MPEEWFWEGSIVAALCKHLMRQGWSIEHIADTKTREAGIDLLARKDDRLLMVEAKGYPSAVYQSGPKIGQRKPTRPANQARNWYSKVLMAAILRQAEHPADTVAIALPAFITYLTLVEKTRHALDKLGIFVLIVAETGQVSVVSPVDSVPL